MKTVLMLVLIMLGSHLYAAENKPTHESCAVKDTIHKNLGAIVSNFINQRPNDNKSKIIDRFVYFVKKETEEIKDKTLTVDKKIAIVLNRKTHLAGIAIWVESGNFPENNYGYQLEYANGLTTLIDLIKKDIEQEYHSKQGFAHL